MAIQLQLRRGTTAENNTFMGAQGEVTIDTSDNTIRVHDGETLGGIKIDKAESVVHKDGNETISGIKTFNKGALVVKNNNTYDGSSHYNGVLTIQDSTGTVTGYIRNAYSSANDDIVDLQAIRNINGTTIYASLGVTISATGDVYAFGPNIGTASNSKNSIILATKEWVNDPSLSLNIVHREGAETIAGTKTFNASPLVPTVSSLTDNSTKAASTAFVLNILKQIYPVGSVYIGTQNTCPMSALFGTWQLVSSGRALWTGNGSNGNSTIAAGLPNITGKFVTRSTSNTSGVFSQEETTSSVAGTGNVSNKPYIVTFSAKNSNSIYGNSSTVQPPAYVVNVWRRTA